MNVMWRLHPADPRAADRLAQACSLHPITAQLLLNRGVTSRDEVARFLHPSLKVLQDPATLPQLPRAVARIRQAIERHEPILIFGDSDVDGLTANVILYEVLRGFGAAVHARQSNRIADGYGLPQPLVHQLCRSSMKLVVLVDCGTNQPEAVQLLASHGIETIIVDHHVPLDDAARPYALVNPHGVDAATGRELSSAGLAFKLAQALVGDDGAEQLEGFLDLAALGTMADCSPLVGDSRILVSEGTARIVRSGRPGLRQLCEDTGTSAADPDQIVRTLVPRLNASGRLGDPAAVWGLLLADAGKQLDSWRVQTQAAHAKTKQLHRQILAEAQEQVNRLHFKDQFVMVVSRQGWHQGLMGPLASQLSQRYGRPAIALAFDGPQGIGSGRSVPLFNLLDALKVCQGLLVRFGGHAQACGLTLQRKDLDEFQALMNRHARSSLGREGLLRTRTVDVELPLEAVTPAWVGETRPFAPFGRGNPPPTVLIRRVVIDRRSPRRAVVTDGERQVLAKGNFSALVPGGRYDILASPELEDNVLTLSVSGVRDSGAP